MFKKIKEVIKVFHKEDYEALEDCEYYPTKMTQDEMIYKIYCNYTLIARFKYEQDRNRCLVALREEHRDCHWTIEGKKQDG